MRLLDDSLQCSADIIDGDCSKTNNGTTKFDSWFKGLRAVYSYMCLPVSTNGTQKSRIPCKYRYSFKMNTIV